MYMACGTEDFLFDANEHFFARFGKELPIEYHTEPGNHTWDFWDRYIERILACCPWTRRRAYEKKLRHGPPSGGGFF